jgi:hypothetical protein
VTEGIENARVKTKMRPMVPLMARDHIIARGTETPASSTSSDICDAESEPLRSVSITRRKEELSTTYPLVLTAKRRDSADLSDQ